MLDVEKIHTYRGPAHVLHGVSLSIKEAEVVCLVGRNGAGKTTTLDSIMGLLPVREGRIHFLGQDISALAPHQRARRGLGYSPEDSGMFPHLSVAENLKLAKLLAGAERAGNEAEIDERIFGVFPEVKTFLARQGLFLSGGQKKMVAVSRAMALSPALLIMDEAFEGLAPIVVNRFRDAVIKIKALGISLLIAESNLVTASNIADRLYAIDRGEIIFHGTPKEALANPEVIRTLRG